LRLTTLTGPPQHRTYIVVFIIETREPLRLIHSAQTWLGFLGEAQKVSCVSPPESWPFSTLLQQFSGELVDRLIHPEARLSLSLAGSRPFPLPGAFAYAQETLPHQRLDALQYVYLQLAVCIAYRF